MSIPERAAGPESQPRVSDAPWRPPLFGPRQGRLTAGQLWTLFAFLVMFVHPVSRNWLIFPLYCITAGVGLARHLRRRAQSPAPLSLLFVIAVGVTLTVIDLLRGSPGAPTVAVSIVFGPCVYYAIALGLDRRTVSRLPAVIAGATFVVSLSIVVVVFAGPQRWMFWLGPVAGSAEVEGTFSVRSIALSSLAGLVPFLVFYLAGWTGPRGRSYGAYVTVLTLAVASALISGRVALILVSLGALIVAPLGRLVWWRSAGESGAVPVSSTRRALPGAYKVAVLLVAALVAMGTFTGLTPGGTFERVLTKIRGIDEETSSTPFAVTSGRSAELRRQQADLLLDGFFDSPLLGDAQGRVSQQIVRSEERPWEYELQYHLLLYRNGLLGAALYVTALGIGINELRRRWSQLDRETRQVTIGAIGAATGMLIANATNPYLRAVGQQWALFLPVMVACARPLRLAADADGAPDGPPGVAPNSRARSGRPALRPGARQQRQ